MMIFEAGARSLGLGCEAGLNHELHVEYDSRSEEDI